MNPTDLCYTPATEIARLIRSKALSPVEVARAVLERVERVNPALNAYCTLTGDLAMDTARAAERAVMQGEQLGRLHGVPYSVKDLNFTKGVRTMGGSFIFEHRVPDTDAPLVRRLKAAGGVMVGKTTSPELGGGARAGSPVAGTTRNRWNAGRTTGGSSAGAGAAAAAGLAAPVQGWDAPGSVRIPASSCGIFGFRPSYGRVPNWPLSNDDDSSH